MYNEGDVMDLTCISVGGRPLPRVTWWVDGSLVDDTYHTEAHDTRVNKLKHLKAERALNGALIECRASNNLASRPQSRILKIDINRKNTSCYAMEINVGLCCFRGMYRSQNLSQNRSILPQPTAAGEKNPFRKFSVAMSRRARIFTCFEKGLQRFCAYAWLK